MASFLTIIPPLTKPIKAIKRPIPTEIEYFKFIGIEIIICSLTLKKDRRIKINPSIKTAANATCQGIFIPITTENAKNAFKLIPEANARGVLV
ncbi:hypothetical protein BVAVS116_B0022 (plasmid) [Borreliella valaisiana VS116]|uniref:Uncharacterized protein n=1 Tax=Borreliella valaisiana VS116 TaxID=445987 RepID=C0R835_BORVA|nr:hypothetical protein BVAVS116_B0022 [Borreliella valaisiana VS116]